MANDTTPDYLTVSGHLKGKAAISAFQRATPNRGDQSRYVATAVTEKLERDDFLKPHPVEDTDERQNQILTTAQELEANQVDPVEAMRNALKEGIAS